MLRARERQRQPPPSAFTSPTDATIRCPAMFASFCSAVYRFSPFQMSGAERATLHAKNERMHVATFRRGIRFYSRLLARL